MGGYVKYFTDLPVTNGYPLAGLSPRLSDDARESGPVWRRDASGRQRRWGAVRRQAIADHAEFCLVQLHGGLPPGARGKCLVAFTPEALSASLHVAIASSRQDQGNQKRRRTGTHPARSGQTTPASACTGSLKSSPSARQMEPEPGARHVYVNADFCPRFAPGNPQLRHHAVITTVPMEGTGLN